MTTFDSTKRLLPDILKDVVAGSIQLPDFQRGWVWDDNKTKVINKPILREGTTIENDDEEGEL